MTLFEIDDAIRKCFVIEETDEVVDTETGEIFDASYLDNLQMQRDKKIENISKWIKNLDSDIEQLKAQKDSFARRQKAAETKRILVRISTVKSGMPLTDQWLFHLENQNLYQSAMNLLSRRSGSLSRILSLIKQVSGRLSRRVLRLKVQH